MGFDIDVNFIKASKNGVPVEIENLDNFSSLVRDELERSFHELPKEVQVLTNNFFDRY